MFIDKVGLAGSYHPSVADGPTPQLKMPGAQVHSQPGTVEHPASAIEKAAHAANTQMEYWSSQIRFNVTNESGKTVVKMVDMQTKQVLLQIPNEQMMQIARNPDKIQGLAIEKRA